MVTYPKDWTQYCINDFLKVKRGASPRPIESYITENANGVNWIKIGDAPKSGKYIVSTKEKITESGAAQSVRVYPGDFLLSNSMSFGRPYILRLEGCIHDGWLRLFDYQETVDDDYLYYLLSSDSIQNQYKSFAAGSGVQNLNKEVVKKVEVCLPSLPEQESIAETLSCMDEHITNLTELIEKKKGIRDGALEDLVSGRTRLKGFSGEWKEECLESITSGIITGGTPSTAISAYWGGTIPWLASTEIHQKRITRPTTFITDVGLRNSSAKIAPKNSVLIALAGQGKTRGTAAFLVYDMAVNQSLAALIVNERADAKFLFYAMERSYSSLRELSSGDGGRGGLNKKLLRQYTISIPCDVKEQEEIANILLSLDDEIVSLLEEKDKMLQIKAGAMDDLLTGRVRLMTQGG